MSAKICTTAPFLRCAKESVNASSVVSMLWKEGLWKIIVNSSNWIYTQNHKSVTTRLPSVSQPVVHESSVIEWVKFVVQCASIISDVAKMYNFSSQLETIVPDRLAHEHLDGERLKGHMQYCTWWWLVRQQEQALQTHTYFHVGLHDISFGEFVWFVFSIDLSLGHHSGKLRSPALTVLFLYAQE